MQILVVDDCPSIREVVCASLRLHGHLTAACESAAVAVELLPYVTACVCDGLGGACFDVVQAAEMLGTSIVIYTGDEEIARAARCIHVPCVRKPGGVDALLDALACREEVAA